MRDECNPQTVIRDSKGTAEPQMNIHETSLCTIFEGILWSMQHVYGKSFVISEVGVTTYLELFYCVIKRERL